MQYQRKKSRATQSFSNRFVTPFVISANYRTVRAPPGHGSIYLDQALELTKLERECCPFLEMEVHWDIENGPVWVDLKGPEDVKDFILDEFRLR